MPIYEYECKNCGKRFEKMQSITAEPLTECMVCGGGPIRRVLHPVGVIFKGSGWYITDSKKPTSSSASGGDSKSESKPEKSESKSESSASAGQPTTETKSDTGPGASSE
jgi:putative FmdB family regulatory protein